MAKLEMKRIEIVALQKDRKKLIELLQRRGLIEISDVNQDGLSKLETAESISRFEKNIHIAIQAKTILDEVAPKKQPMMAAFMDLRGIEKHEFGGYIALREEYLKNCYDIIHLHQEITESRAEIIRGQTQADILKIWLNLDIPMKYSGTKYTRCYIGSVPKLRTSEEILVDIQKVDPELEAVQIEVISAFKELTCIAVFCYKSISSRVFNALRERGFVQPSELTENEPKARIEQYEKEIKLRQTEIDEKLEKIKSYSDKHSDIEFLIDYLSIRKDKYIALNKLGMTKNTFVISGYISLKYADRLITEIENKFTAVIDLQDPAEDDDVPVLLENSNFSAGVESITEMYALPGKQDVDPNPIMAFFYYLFFGMMLSDAGYGIIMVLVSWVFLKKFSLKESMRKTLIMFFYCGISTVIWGALFGSWFGDLVQIISTQFFHKTLPSLALWFEPIKDPMTLLLFAFGLGIVHLFLGLAVHFKILWKNGQKADAVFDVIPIYLLVLGAAPLAAGILVKVPTPLSQIGKYLALTGVLAIILTAGRSSKNIFARLGGGLYGLYNIASGYLSDILSYSRLLALGLATGSIAGVINMMGSMVENVYLKAVLLLVLFLVGHPLNMAINLLGAYVHTNRLQFVELFSKFYEGGGRAFSPLRVNTKYIKFKEDN